MTDLPPAPDEGVTLDLVRRAQGGEDEAGNLLFEHYHDHLLLAVRLRLGPRMRSALESVDVFQSVALEVYRDLDGFTPQGEGSFGAYLNAVVLNKIRSRARYLDAAKRQGTERLPEQDLDRLPARGSEVSYHDPTGRFERLEREIGLLPDEQREVLLMRRFDGLASKEVARLLGKSDAAVRKLYSRAVASLALRMDQGETP